MQADSQRGGAQRPIRRLMTRMYQGAGGIDGVTVALNSGALLLMAVAVPLAQWVVDGFRDDLGFAALSFAGAFAAPASLAAVGCWVLRTTANRRRRRAPISAVAAHIVITAVGWAATYAVELTLRPVSTQPTGTSMWFEASLLAGLVASILGSVALIRAASPSSFAAYTDELNDTFGDEARSMGLKLSDRTMFELWAADVPAHAAAELLRQGQIPAQIIAAYSDGTPPALATGAL